MGQLVLTAVVLAMAMVPAMGQKLPPCPEGFEESKAVLALCQEALPANGLLLQDGSGDHCTCRCMELLGKPTAVLDTLRRARNERYVQNARMYHARNASTTTSTSEKPWSYEVTMTHCSLQVNDGDRAACAVDDQVLDILRALSCLSLVHLQAVTVRIRGEENSFPTYRSVQQSSNDPPQWRIELPARFLDDPAVGDELIRFMILHEIGHTVRNEENEYAADDWAARVALPEYFGGDWTGPLGANHLERVNGQLANFMRSIYPEEWDHASNCTLAINCYPRLACRCAGINGAFVHQLPNQRFVQGYPTLPWNCWTPTASFALAQPIPEPSEPCAQTLPGPVAEATSRIIEELSGITNRMGKPFDPALCERIDCSTEAWRRRVDAAWFKRSIRRMERRSARLTSLADRMRMRLENTP